MAHSLFQRHSATGFRGRYDQFADDDLRPRRYNLEFGQRRTSHGSLFWRSPLIVKIILLLMCSAAGIIFGSVVWLVIGALML